MTRIPQFVAIALLSTAAACSGGGDGEITAPEAPVEAVAAPEGGEWSDVIAKTPSGGYRMGNPEAPVTLVEYGSLTCSACAYFETSAVEPLVEQYVDTGRVSYEFRNYVRDAVDMTAALIARCGTEQQYFGIQKAMFETQQNWLPVGYAYLRDTPGIAQMEPADLFAKIADVTGLKTFAAQRGIAPAKIDACLAAPGAADTLLAINSEGEADYGVNSTPTHVVNGKTQEARQWEAGQGLPGLSDVLATAVGE